MKDSEIILRDGEKEFFEYFYESKIPVLLFSAGISNIVQAAMVYKASAGFTDNMKGIFLRFI